MPNSIGNRMYCWGNDAQGQAGRGKTGAPVALDHSLQLTFNPQMVVCGWDHTVALDLHGGVWAWGSNEFGQLGDGSEKDRLAPRCVKGLKHLQVAQVACGAHSTAAVVEPGRLFTWGRYTMSNSPHEVHLPFPVQQVSCGFAHMAAVTRGGRLFTWGYNERGELGHGDTFGGLRKPREVKYFQRTGAAAPGHQEGSDDEADMLLEEEEALRVVTVSCGAHHNAAIVQGDQVYTWGDGSCGQLGHLTGHRVLAPKHVAALEHSGVVQLSCGAKHTAFVTREGALMVCGHHGYGVLGLGKPSASLEGMLNRMERQLYMGTGKNQGDPIQRVPTTVVPFGIQQVSCGAGHTVICTHSGQVWACGYNCYGQCSGSLEGGAQEVWQPRLLDRLSAGDVRHVAAGAGHTAVLSSPQTLSHLCQRALIPHITIESAPTLWEYSRDFMAENLGFSTIAFMKNHVDEVLQSESFQRLPPLHQEELRKQLEPCART